MKKEKKVLMEKFKGFNISYDKEEERFVADKPNSERHFEGRSLWEIKGYIRESKTEDVNKKALIESGYFGKQIAKIHLMSINKETKSCDYKVVEDTGEGYDIGRTKKNQDLPKMYPLSKENLSLYVQVKELQEDIEKIENKQKILVSRLK